MQKLPTDNFFITPNDITALLSEDRAKGVTVHRYETVAPPKKPPSVVEYSPEKQMTIEPMRNNSNHRRLEKIKKSIKQEEKKY